MPKLQFFRYFLGQGDAPILASDHSSDIQIGSTKPAAKSWENDCLKRRLIHTLSPQCLAQRNEWWKDRLTSHHALSSCDILWRFQWCKNPPPWIGGAPLKSGYWSVMLSAINSKFSCCCVPTSTNRWLSGDRADRSSNLAPRDSAS